MEIWRTKRKAAADELVRCTAPDDCRREFLKLPGATRSPLVQRVACGLHHEHKGRRHRRIAIVGGGVPGLNAPHKLQAARLRATFMRNSPRTGGRLHGEKRPESWPETEARRQFIDSSTLNARTRERV